MMRRMTSQTDVERWAFTAERARALTALTARQLQYWDEQGFITPSLTKRKGRGRKRLYSFRDLVALKVAAKLRESFSLQLIRSVSNHLRALDYRAPLAELQFAVVDDRLYFQEAAHWQEGRPAGQIVAQFVIDVGAIADDLRGQIVKLDERKSGEIERRRGVLGGQPVIAGTRITVRSVQNLARDGATAGQIIELYPDLTADDINAALATELPRRRHKRAS
jgi:uncharacterized protein (DUF433 family)